MEIVAKLKCASNGCPTIYLDLNEDIIVQGYDEVLATPEGESAVRLPKELFLEAAQLLNQN